MENGKIEPGRHKTRGLSIRFQIMIPATCIIILICVAMGLMFNSRTKGDMVISGGELADYIGKLTVQKINGSLVSRLEPGAEGTAPYIALEAPLENMMKDSAIKSMHIFYTDGQKVYYGLDKSSQPVASGTEYCDYDRLHLAFEGYSIRRSGIDMLKDGAVISAYRPIYDRTMKLVGVWGCDYDADGIVDAINRTLSNIVIFGAVCIVVAILIFFLVSRRVTRNLWRVDDKIREIVSSNGDLTQKIRVRTGDEVECIAEHVNDLLVYMGDIMSNIFSNSKELNMSSEDMVTHLKNTQDNVTQVSATMEEMSANMQETSNSINRVYDSISEAYTFISGVNERVQSGGELRHCTKITS